MKLCKAIGCESSLPKDNLQDFCDHCVAQNISTPGSGPSAVSMSVRYPAYYKDFSDVTEADVYLIHARFQLNDHSGCLHHASKKILLSGARTGGKSAFKDIKEARDTLTRWLEIHTHLAPEA